MSEIMFTAEDYEAAAEIVESSWGQHDYVTWGDDDVPENYCLLGAMGKVKENNAYVFAIGVSESDLIAKSLGFKTARHLTEWNDDPHRDKSEVYDLLMNKAKELRNV